MRPKTRSLALAGAAPLLLLLGCAPSPRNLPGGATEAAVFFTPRVRDARAAAGHVFPSQHPEYARRDAAAGVRPAGPDRATLYPPQPGYRVTTRYEQTRVVATDDGYRVTERSHSYTTGGSGHRRR